MNGRRGTIRKGGIVPATEGRLVFTGRQGAAMGRPRDVRVRVDVRPDGGLLVAITGDPVTAFRAELAHATVPAPASAGSAPASAGPCVAPN
ncbi:hypothetical protein ACIQ7Q_25070 [Streptomyces sp. NPDC096176]|uniref:hypothetical protein n=1 Tax=Streptomyces sp. NPDC096176 TaxID=3366079 RepID=UPI00381D2C93